MRMNLLEEHKFGEKSDYIDDGSVDINMPKEYTNILYYWNLGQKFRQSPLFNGVCYRCGHLLQGKINYGKRFTYPRDEVDENKIPVETMYSKEQLPAHLPYKSQYGNYYACRNCMNNRSVYLVKKYPLVSVEEAHKTRS